MLRTSFSHLKNFWGGFSGVEQKLLLLFIFILVISLGVVVTRDQKRQTLVPAYGGRYTEGLVGQPQHLNPLLGPSNDVDMDLSRVIYAGLYKFDQNLNLVPDLAEAPPEISPNGKEYLVRLKENLVWQDGRPLTADDVVFTFQIVQNPEYQSPLRFSWNRVEVEKIDERQIKLTTREASSPFVANLVVGILPKHIWETVPVESFGLSKFNLEPVGSGPFQVKETKRGGKGEVREIRLEAFERYHQGRPFLKNLVFKFFSTTDELINAYQARDIDGLGYVPFDRSLFIKPKASLQQINLPLPQYQAVFINRAKNPAPLEDVRVRMALARAIDKQKIIAEVYGGQASPAFGPILEGHLGYHEQIPGAEMNLHDPERAKSLLEEAGWVVEPPTGLRQDKQGRIITLELATNNFSPNVRVAEMLKAMWERIGVQIILKIETPGDLEEKFIRPRNYELLLFSENVGADPDPFPFWHSSQLRDPGLNLSTFSNRQADKLLVEARANIPQADRAAKYRQFQEIFVGDAPAIFITRSVYVYNISTRIKGVEVGTIVTPADRFTDISRWHIETKKIKK